MAPAAAGVTAGVEAAFKDNPSISKAISDSFQAATGVIDAPTCKKNAAECCAVLQKLLKADGVRTTLLSKREVAFFTRDAPTAAPGSFTAAEYQALVETLTKYAALKARHNNGRRWGLGVSLSAAGAVALTAAVFSSAGLLLIAAAPAGAAIGAVAVAADGSSSRRRDRRTAKRSSSKPTAPPAAAAAEEQPAVVCSQEQQVAPATRTVGTVSSSTTAAGKRIVAPTPVDATADASTDDDTADVPAPVPCDSPFAAASRDTTSAGAASDPVLMPPAAVRTNNSSSSLLMAFGAGGAPAAGAGALLPPKPVKKGSKSLTKKMSKSMSKSLKKAFSLKDRDAVKGGSSRADSADDSGDSSPLAPPVPRRSLTFFRRSSSDLMGSAGGADVDGELVVEGSKGSATIKKMVEGIRRSFSIDRPSIDLFTNKRARKSSATE